jgi:glycosyltransferase involved in cell wall biosynthesis
MTADTDGTAGAGDAARSLAAAALESSVVAVIIPCLNEAATIGKVVTEFRLVLPFAEIIVVDNRSTDGTKSVAAAVGATVISETRRGKGHALVRGFQAAREADRVIIVDGDDTYPPEDALRLLAELDGGAEMAIGTRLLSYEVGAFSRTHSLGNRLFVWLVRLLFGVRTQDLLSGYRAFTRRFLDLAALLATGFEIEAELSLQALAHEFEVAEVPVRYRARPKASISKLSAFRDGRRILLALLAFFRDYRPMTFFGLLGLALVASSLLAGIPVVAEYLRTGLVLRLPLAVLAVGLALLGAMALLGGVILSSVKRRAAELAAIVVRRN